MYLSYFGLDREPFHITPDPDFLYPSPCHKEAFAAVMYGVQQQKGFVVVTGEVGTGKTTLLRAYIQKLKGTDVQPIYIFDPHLSFDELLEAIMHECGNDTAGLSQFARLQWLRHYLIDLYEKDKSVVLVIDEAQNMPVETLENLRVLTNLETTKDKLLQVLLVGQPELEEKLGLHGLRQLNQRVAVRANLRQLTKQESADYIRHRLIQAGGSPDEILAGDAINAIVAHAKGNPRVLNITCDNVLISAFGARHTPVRAALVKEVIRDLTPKRPSQSDWKRYVPVAAAAGIAAAVILGGGASVMMLSDGVETAPVEASVKPAEPSPAPAEAVVETPSLSPAAAEKPAVTAKVDVKQITMDKMREYSESAAPAVLEAPAPVAETVAEALPEPAVASIETAEAVVVEAPAAEVIETAKLEPAEVVEATEPIPTAVAVESEQPENEVPLVETPAPIAEPAAEPVETETPVAPEPVVLDSAVETPEPAVSPAPAEKPADFASEAKVVQLKIERGDQLIRLVQQVYGHSSPALLEKVLAANPQLQNPDLIWAGDKLVFPEIETSKTADAAQ
ncbi:MAG: AAA family ATPase [Candidatus Hydrogenedens sp.]|nr:AAA family ATPase [Candidatus Hydrogenedens sp.]